MSQIETIMLFALGFILAALIAMFLGRGLWNYGVKIGQRRMQKLSPLSITEVQADRDRLRAEYAVMTRKLELRLDDLKDRMAEQMAEVSRNKTRIEKLHAEVDERDTLILARDQELASLKANMAPLESELAARTASIQQLKEQLRNKAEMADNLERENVQLRMQAEDRNAAAIEFEKQAATLAEQVKVETELSSTEKALADKFARISELTETIEGYKSDLSNQQKEIETLVSSGTDGTKSNSKKGLANAAKLSREAGSLEKSMAEAEAEAQKLRKELENLDQDWEARKKERAETKKAADKAQSEAPRKSATVTPLRPLAKNNSADVDADKPAEGKKSEPKTVAAKMMAATKAAAGKRAKASETPKKKTTKKPEPKQAEDEQAEMQQAAVANEAVNGTNGAKNGSGGPKVQKVLSLAQRIRALQNEITN